MRLVYTPEAVSDLRSIKRYISKDLKAPKAAKRIVDMIQQSCIDLKMQPLMGFALNSKIDTPSDYRCLVCEHWVAFYLTDAESITIVRILDGRTDYLRALF